MSTSDRPSAASTGPAGEPGLLAAEQDIKLKLDDRSLDFASLLAVSNIYWAAGAVLRTSERDLLGPVGLSWGGFTILWVLWIWGSMETARLAAECDLAKGTLTGMLTTLEKQELVNRDRMSADRRRVLVSLTPTGTAKISELFPRFNGFEAAVTDGLSDEEKTELARLLRLVIVNANDNPTR